MDGWIRLTINHHLEVDIPCLGWRPCRVQDAETGIIGMAFIYATKEQAQGDKGHKAVRISWTESDEPPY